MRISRKSRYLVLALISIMFLLVLVSGCGEADRSESGFKQEVDSKKIFPKEDCCYMGVFPGWGSMEDSVDMETVKDFEKLSGKSVVIVPFSNFWGEESVSKKQLNEIGDHGSIPLLRMMPWGEPYWEPFEYQADYSLQKIINGDFDDFLKRWAHEIRSYGKPVMITFAVEMNGDWFPWSGIFQGGRKTNLFEDQEKPDGPERYVEAYRHIVRLFREINVENCIWLFQPNWQSFPEEDWNAIENYYPGDKYVDWVGISLYGASYSDDTWQSFEALMDPIYEKMTQSFPNKPFMLAEWGVREGGNPELKAAWYKDALATLITKYKKLRIAIVYNERFETEQTGDWADLRINSSPQALEAYQEGISNAYYKGRL